MAKLGEKLTDEQKKVISENAKKREEDKRQKRAALSVASEKVGGNGGGHSGGDNPRVVDGGGDQPNGDHPRGVASAGAAPKIGDKIPPRSVNQIVVEGSEFFKGLPSLVKLVFKALGNCLKLWNLLPFPLKIELEPLDEEESKCVSEAMKPGLNQISPALGKKHPIKMLIFTGVAVFFAKVKASWKPRPKAPGKNNQPGPNAAPINVEPQGVDIGEA